MWMKTRLTQGAIVCVCGDRKWTLSTTTVTHILQRREWLVTVVLPKSTHAVPKGKTIICGAAKICESDDSPQIQMGAFHPLTRAFFANTTRNSKRTFIRQLGIKN